MDTTTRNQPHAANTSADQQHVALAQAWCRWNNQKGTEKQARKVMRQLTHIDLLRMLDERGIDTDGITN